MPLTEIRCKTVKPLQKPQKIADAQGLYLEVMPNGAKYWRLKYRYLGLEKRLALGVYPEVSLADARAGKEAARRMLAQGIDPSALKKQEKRQALRNSANTFEAIAREWYGNQSATWSKKHFQNVTRRLELYVFPEIGSLPIANITAPILLDALRKIEARETLDTAGRVRQIAGQIFRYGIATGKCERDLSADLKGALKPFKAKHYAALGINDMPEFLKKLDTNEARLYPRTRRAVKMLMYTFVRTGELINATWDEIDFDKKVWIVPAARMKMGKDHIVPLSQQVIKLLKEQKEELTGINTPYIFPSQIRPKEAMSNGTILGAIKRLGYKGAMTGHGFRALARTAIRENLKYDADIIERQLAHAPRSKVIAAYDRAEFLKERTKMMQQWANYLDTNMPQGNVIPRRSKGTDS